MSSELDVCLTRNFFSLIFLFDYFWGIWRGEGGTKVLLSFLGVGRLVDKMYLGTGQVGSFVF